eukprot:10316-Hanusia_phi.AAC.1
MPAGYSSHLPHSQPPLSSAPHSLPPTFAPRTCQPSMMGMLQSIRMMSYLREPVMFTASKPFSTASMVCPCLISIASSSLRFAQWSSTMRMFT